MCVATSIICVLIPLNPDSDMLMNACKDILSTLPTNIGMQLLSHARELSRLRQGSNKSISLNLDITCLISPALSMNTSDCFVLDSNTTSTENHKNWNILLINVTTLILIGLPNAAPALQHSVMPALCLERPTS